MSRQLRLVLHKEIPETHEFHDTWNRLVFSMEAPEVFYTCEWALAVSRAYTNTLHPLVFTAYREDELAGIAALALEAEKKACFLAGATADYCDFISSPSDRHEFVQSVFAELRHMGIGDVFLTNIPAESPTIPVLRTCARDFGFFSSSRPAYWCSQVALRSAEQRRKVSQSARRKARRFVSASQSPAHIAHEADHAWLANEFSAFAEAHVGRFLHTGRLSNLVRSERRMFLHELANLLSKRGWFAASRLSVDGNPIAWNYGFQFAGKWFWYQPAFKVEAAEQSPGSLLLCRILERASTEAEIHTVDLGLGDEGYKNRYANSGRRTLCFAASRSAAKAAIGIGRYHASRLLKKSAFMEQKARVCRDRLLAVKQNGLPAAAKMAWSRLRNQFAPCEVFFFDLAKVRSLELPLGLRLEPVSIDLLARAAMDYEKDPETLNYLLRSARRVSAGREGFALSNKQSQALHFCWVAPFENFEMAELKRTLHEPGPSSMLLFDCWTPQAQRGRGYYGLTISLVAHCLLQRAQRPWIFSASTNSSSMRGLERTGAIRSFALVRRPGLLGARISISNSEPRHTPAFDLHPAA